MIYMVIIIPDLVFRVICQKIAYCTREDPNRDMFWLSKNNTIFFIQSSDLDSVDKTEPPFYLAPGLIGIDFKEE